MPYYCQYCQKAIRGKIFETEKIVNNSIFLCLKCSNFYRKQLQDGIDAPRFRPFDRNDSFNIQNCHNMPGYLSDSASKDKIKFFHNLNNKSNNIQNNTNNNNNMQCIHHIPKRINEPKFREIRS